MKRMFPRSEVKTGIVIYLNPFFYYLKRNVVFELKYLNLFRFISFMIIINGDKNRLSI